MTYAIAPVIILAAIAAFLGAHRRVRLAAQKLRFELADRGEALLANPELPPRARTHISFLLDRAFGMRGPILLGYVAVPFIALLLAFQQRWLKSIDIVDGIASASVRAEFRDVCRIHDRLTFANNPVMMVLLEFEILVFLPLAVFVRAASSASLPTIGNREAVIAEVEDRSIYVSRKLGLFGNRLGVANHAL